MKVGFVAEGGSLVKVEVLAMDRKEVRYKVLEGITKDMVCVIPRKNNPKVYRMTKHNMKIYDEIKEFECQSEELYKQIETLINKVK